MTFLTSYHYDHYCSIHALQNIIVYMMLSMAAHTLVLHGAFDVLLLLSTLPRCAKVG